MYQQFDNFSSFLDLLSIHTDYKTPNVKSTFAFSVYIHTPEFDNQSTRCCELTCPLQTLIMDSVLIKCNTSEIFTLECVNLNPRCQFELQRSSSL